jgi:hypothetical protein
VRINVRGGTADHTQRSLCETCRWSTVIRGKRLGEEIVECVQLADSNRRIPFAVMECSDYIHRNRPSLQEMEAIATILRPTPRRSDIGFASRPGAEKGDTEDLVAASASGEARGATPLD